MRGRLCSVVVAAGIMIDGCQLDARQAFRTGVDGISVNVSVRARNQPVSGLTAADFEVLDNGVRQEISTLSLDAVPIDLTVVFDTSGSVSGAAFTQLTDDVRNITAQLGATDRVRVITFGSTVKEILPMQEVGSGPRALTAVPQGATSFFHAIVAALLPEAAAGRPHLVVVLSDGADNVSFLDAKDVEAVARRSDAVLHVVLRGALSRSSAGPRVGWVPYYEQTAASTGTIRAAAEATGGRFRQERLERPMVDVFRQVVAEFRSSYMLWFSPKRVERSGWHDLTVRVTSGKYSVVARRGYFSR